MTSFHSLNCNLAIFDYYSFMSDLSQSSTKCICPRLATVSFNLTNARGIAQSILPSSEAIMWQITYGLILVCFKIRCKGTTI